MARLTRRDFARATRDLERLPVSAERSDSLVVHAKRLGQRDRLDGFAWFLEFCRAELDEKPITEPSH